MNWKNIFKRRFKPKLLDDKYKIIEAFTLGNTRYLMYDNAFEVPTGRMFAALAIYTEMEMRCDRQYLEAHCKAMEKILSDRSKINLTTIMQLNVNLKERLDLMILPEFIYKLASVIYFDETESPYSYDYDYNQKKIARWKEEHEVLDFFMSRLAAELVPSLRPAVGSSKMFSQVAQRVDEMHRNNLTEVLSPQ